MFENMFFLLIFACVVVDVSGQDIQLPTGHQLDQILEEGFRQVDLNHNGVLEMHELRAIYAFEDADGDGNVTMEEYKRASPVPAAIAETVFKYFDHDHDGVLHTSMIFDFYSSADENDMARYILLMQNRHRQIERRVFIDRQNPLDFMDDTGLIRNYRLDRQAIFDLCAGLNNGLQRPTYRNHALPVSLSVVLALRYFATGSFQSVIAHSHGVNKMSVSRSIHAVAAELCNQSQNYIHFPVQPAKMARTKQGYYEVGGFANVIGAVDGTLIPVKPPSAEEHLYITRKGFHAINVQGICDSHQLFLNLVVRWPGSTYDAYIWNNSAVCTFLSEGNYNNTWLLGDSAYPLKPYLLTPVLAPATDAERRYNAAHKRTRCIIERTYGIWKMRFRCLHKSGGYLTYSPQKNINIICATGVLHNICVRRKLPISVEDNDGDEGNDDNEEDDDVAVDQNDQDRTGRQVRAQLILDVFSRDG